MPESESKNRGKLTMAYPPNEEFYIHQIIKNQRNPGDVQMVSSLKPLWIALQMVGLYPVHTADKDGAVPIIAALYTALCYAVLIVLLAAAALSGPPNSDSEPTDFDSSVSAYAMYLLLALPAVMPPFYFCSRNKLHRYLMAWAEFEEEFLSATGSQLQLPRVPWALVILGAAVWPAAGGALLLPLLNRGGRPLWLAALAAHSVAQSSLLTATAALHCRAARSAAKGIAASLDSHAGDVVSLDAHRYLWLRLSRLVRDLGAGLLGPLSALLLSHFSLLTLASYALLGSLLNTASLPVPAAAFLVATAATTLTTCCDSGHRTATQIRGVVEDKLEEIRENPSSPVWLYTMMVSTMVTYLVVIVQFRVSHEVLKISHNETNVFSTRKPIPMSQ